jgi:two-component system chemotaxis sensor kinase CheA
MVYEGEADAELFDIFMEQLAAGIGAVDGNRAGQMARGEAVAQAVEEMTDQVDRLAATANYMGYDALSAVYDDDAGGVGTFSSRSEAAGADDIDDFCNRPSSPVSPASGRFSPMPNR